jgi:hypothetical protein
MKTVTRAQDRTGNEEIGGAELALPASAQVALGELVNAAKDGLLALSVGVGLGVLHELMETEVDEVVGPKSQHDPQRTAVRHGHEAGEVTLGGRGSGWRARGSARRTTARRRRSTRMSISPRAIR